LNKYTLILYLSFLFLPLQSFGQESIVLSGQITDANKQAVAAGNVFLLSTKDSSIIRFGLISDGKFSLDNVSVGNYILKISCAGFQEELQPISLSANKNITVVLKRLINALQEVTVTDTKKAFTNEGGNIRMNVANAVFSAVSNPVDLLSKMPTVQISSDKESISIVGRGNALIYIDNQRASVNDVKSLSVDDIKSIEIINNPSAKYEAEGKAVILITRKINKKEGTKIDIAENGTYGKYYNNRAGINASYKKKKLELKGNFEYNQYKDWYPSDANFRIDSPVIISNYSLLYFAKVPQFIAGAGAFYQINTDDYFSMAANVRTQNENRILTTNSYTKLNGAESNVISTNNRQNPETFFNSNLNYNKKLKKINGGLFIGAQYSGFQKKSIANIYNNFNDTQDSLAEYRYQKSNVDVVSGRIDFDKTFTNKMKFETGINISNAKSKSLFTINSYVPPGTTYWNYLYKESDYAGYAQLSGKIKKISYVAGLRLENTNVQSGYVDSALIINRKNADLFPRITVDVPLDSTKTLTFNYSKSITRPDYSSAVQQLTYVNPYFEWASNVNINPSTEDIFFINLTYKDYAVKLGYYMDNGPVNTSFTYNPQDTLLIRQDVNYKSSHGTFLNLTIPFKYKFFTSNNVASIEWDDIQTPQAVSGSSTPYFYLSSFNEFALPKKYIFSITGWSLSNQNQGAIQHGGLFNVDAAVSKVFFKKLNCAAGVNNIFNSNNYQESFAINGVHYSGTFYGIREVFVSLKYSFGSIKDSKYTNKQVDENSNRLK
jgi:hypothetical protein